MNQNYIHEDRRKKIKQLRERGISPYPAKITRSHSIGDVLAGFNELEKQDLAIVGRVRAIRGHGALQFIDLEDEFGNIQLLAQKDFLGESFNQLKLVDIGDFLEACGVAVFTERKQKALRLSAWRIIAKTLRPLPEKFHGLQDTEEKLRRRYLDLALNPDTRALFRRKEKFWQVTRDFLRGEGFMEARTPVLERTTGGADANPFITHHDTLDIDLCLRISLELPLKRLIGGGYEKVFEIGPVFRNEGIDAEHLQDYDLCEVYWAYADYEQMMGLVETLYQALVREVYGRTKFRIREYEVDFAGTWPRRKYGDILRDDWGIDISRQDQEEIRRALKKAGAEVEPGLAFPRLVDALWKLSRKKIGGPTLVIDPPIYMSPLAKRKESDPELAERFWVVIGGSEIGNAYSELNDPEDQRARFMEQQKMRDAGDHEAQMMDEDFVEMLEYGMPPTAGFGFSERLFAFLEDKPMRETVFFPPLRERASKAPSEKKIEELAIPREQSLALLEKHLKEKKNFYHSLESEAVLRALAEKLGEPVELWDAAGLLHDLDWEETENSPERHGLISAKYLRDAGYPAELISAIERHNFNNNQKGAPSTKLDFALRAGETVTGLIYACALVHPDRKLAAVEVTSLKKKMKDKSFAALVSRETIKECDKLNLSLDEFLELALGAMRKIANKIGL